ncbi:hypothetical protein SEA_TWISTER6_77 [Gordonia phage Twister6]|uniref:Uncharacterized protein n=3 Tax=Wizardvirus TaxID=2169658 RepID=A0A6M3TAE0_9CAUD|nr:hypothetical protein BI083_gp77 [Gordonia phage Twister6]YP_010102039.1 hypothetical protein KNU53_gp77 [Gordonia phage SmokingBunny]YP_010107712.1 hypothetical protein KNV01_gp76 [Gordonia phage Evamon]UVK62398.1 hypothetical protein SEA_SALVADOR_76 [Gordonia phage Salvador]WAA20294.1 hypothetical protein SEA_TOGO_76 [Gordonia phage Togo]AOE44986.1 hypothetical protein SEA_TWISTER6_77 [Gordonia phage Twister6]QCG77888.1 hypothetical protein SEA_SMOKINGBUNNY_77 [Gordonia phage SmokingBunny
MTHPGPRNHTEKPSTPPAGPSGVSHQSADSSPPTPINLADEVVRMTAMVEQNLRVLLDTFGIPYTEWPAKTCRAALHRVGAGDPPGGVPCSLHLGHDGKHITESGRAWADPTDQQIRHVVDIVADVRAAGGSRSYAIDGVKIMACDERGRTNADHEAESMKIRADQAEARVAELDSALRSVLDAVNNLDTGYNAVKINGVRIALARAGYGTHPDTGEKR